ncbi:CoA-transferase family III [Sparassis latifolia]
MTNPVEAVRYLWESASLPSQALSRLVLSEDPDPSVNSSFKLGSAALASQSAIALSGLSTVAVDARHAVLEFRSEAWYIVNGRLPSGSLFDDLAGLYKTKDNSYVRLHTNFPHHRQGILDILRCEPTKEAVANALLQWNAVGFETEASSRKMVATAVRSFAEWDEHPQGRALANTLPVQLIKVADAPRRKIAGARGHPLDGIRVLELTRVLAGPVCGRTLAGHGADVLWITSPSLPALPLLDIETSRGKRTTQLDLASLEDRQTLAGLVKEADVFLQAYRPGGLHDKGFGVDNVMTGHRGVVYASLNAYGWEGPWKDRRGFDSLVQTATGFNLGEAEAHASYAGEDPAHVIPRAFPMQALDHAAGYLLAFGINAALCKTITEGGSWEVRVSLAAVGQWIRYLGRLDPMVAFGVGRPFPPHTLPQDPEIAVLATAVTQLASDKPAIEHHDMTAIRHAAILSKTPVMEGQAPMGLNVHEPGCLGLEEDPG